MGKNVAQIGVRYDNDEVDRYEWVGRGEDGFPQPEGKKDTVIGKNFEIWKVDTENPVDDELRGVIRTFCEELVQSCQ
eukprot:jgi/Botrbrau1/12510/Bobra.0169s0052.1